MERLGNVRGRELNDNVPAFTDIPVAVLIAFVNDLGDHRLGENALVDPEVDVRTGGINSYSAVKAFSELRGILKLICYHGRCLM